MDEDKAGASDLRVSEMLRMQYALWEKHKDSWSPMTPLAARNSLLWMMCEVGEVIDIVKKRGEESIAGEPAVRAHFVEELCDVLMYFLDVLNRYGISSQEISDAYLKKHGYNMVREFEGD